jgi:tetratricopeptide (TPR) repeat protein
MLASPNELTLAKVHLYALRVQEFIDLDGINSHYMRWVTSLWYAVGLLWKSVGDLEKSLQSFLNCADCEILVYSPLLATKTVGACRIAGTLLFQAGRRDEAKTIWTKGISLAEGAIKGDWREIHGDIESPFTFGLREAAEILDCANRCADGLSHLALRDDRSGLLDETSFAARVDESERRLGLALSELDGLRSSAPARLVRAIEADNRDLKRFARIGYLLAVILLPTKVKVWLKPVAAILRKRFE